MTARYDHSDLKKTVMVVHERNKEFIAQKKVVGDVEGLNISILRIFTGK
ncbi:MAG: hypothetical protein LBK82_08525 [Planctomycetaceae bacterium]|jgi:hypothetical protein|nr:hypothetical protein [Planctomycetaceae bacterium]